MSAIHCPCGAVELEISGEPLAQFYCHCADCRRAHGAAYTLEAVYAADQARVVRGDTVSLTLKRTPRISCANCGTRLYADLGNLRGVSGTLLPGFEASMHINYAEALAPVRDDLPHYLNMPEAFGGDGKLAEG